MPGGFGSATTCLTLNLSLAISQCNQLYILHIASSNTQIQQVKTCRCLEVFGVPPAAWYSIYPWLSGVSGNVASCISPIKLFWALLGSKTSTKYLVGAWRIFCLEVFRVHPLHSLAAWHLIYPASTAPQFTGQHFNSWPKSYFHWTAIHQAHIPHSTTFHRWI